MGKQRMSIKDRVIAVLLALVMAVSLLPTTALAANTGNPNSFTIYVTDESNSPLEGAEVSYDIKNDGNTVVTSATVSTGADGYAIVNDMNSYSSEIAAGKITFSYTISKAGYVSAEEKDTVVSTANESISQTLKKQAQLMAKIDVSKSGNGTVKINGAEADTHNAAIGSKASVEITPVNVGGHKTYIKSLSIAGTQIPVKKYDSYTNSSIEVSGDIAVDVVFVTEYTVTASVSQTEMGNITLNGQSDQSVTVDAGNQVTVNVTPKEGYQISNVSINGTDRSISNRTVYTETVTVDQDYTISASFEKIYTLTVNYDGIGAVKVDGSGYPGGNVVYKEGSDFEVTASPNANYRVSEVVKNGVSEKFNTNDKEYTDQVQGIDKNYTYEITFLLNTFTVTKEAAQNGAIEIANPTVEHDGSTTVNFIPEDGYVVDEVLVDNTAVDVVAIESYSGQITINNITADKKIKASFKKMDSVQLDEVNFNKADSIREDGTSGVYVFKDKVTFQPTASGAYIRINSKERPVHQSWEIKESVKIESIEISEGRFKRWKSVKLPQTGLYIIVDKDDPKLEVQKNEANKYGYDNSDVEICIDAEDISAEITTGSGSKQKKEVVKEGYSGLEKISYTVQSDGTETQRGSWDNLKQVKAKKDLKFTVDAEKNNSDNVMVTVEAEDTAGNVTTKTLDMKINHTAPEIKVEIDGQLGEEAAQGYYQSSREAKVTIIDRNSCFDEMAAENGIEIKANTKEGAINLSKNAMLSEWTHKGDTHTAVLTFSTEANYEWSFSYTNKAGLANKTVTASGDSVFQFTIDKTPPTGIISMEDNTWDTIAKVLTFGIWKNHSVTAEAAGEDQISPIYETIKYYKSNKTEALTLTELDDLYKNGKFIDQTYTVDPDELFAVYARIMDYAGNVVYIGTNGVIVDNTKSQIVLTPEPANEYGFYKDDVKVNISVSDCLTDSIAYSGINSIDYRIENNGKETQSGNLYKFAVPPETGHPAQAELKKDWTGTITVDKTKNNGDNIRIIVTSVDNAGVEASEISDLSINTDPPEVDISVEGTPNRTVEEDGSVRGYYSNGRKATVTIEDRASTFNEEKATQAFKVAKAVDSQGESIKNVDAASMISKWTTEGNTHTATITFAEDANYEWSYQGYVNKADLEMKEPVTEGNTPYLFTVDTKKPKGKISVDQNSWEELLNIITFGLYKNVSAKVTATAEDKTSPFELAYYKTSSTNALSEEELDKQEFKEYQDFTVNPNEQFAVYLRMTDYAGNYKYISTNGFIVDNVSPVAALEPEKPNKAGIYGDTESDTVNVDVKVTDASPYSGIKTVEYWVEKDGNSANVTQSGTLFSFDIENPAHSDLVEKWEGNISVSKKLNNSCNTGVYVKVTDNAGNSSIEKVLLDIDITHPEIQVTYDNNMDNGGNSYFDADRKAKIVITERTHHFDEVEAKKGISIQAVDSQGIKVSLDTDSMITGWETKEDRDADSAIHIAEISYSKDANYTFSISYTDKADNQNQAVQTSDSTAPYRFTVDKTAPSGAVTAVSEEGRKTAWNDLISHLTFGYWSGKKISLSADTYDLTSPIASVEYFKTDSDNELSLDTVKESREWKPFTGFFVTPNEQLTVYLKIVDMAGNTTYISTDGMIADDTAPREEAIAPEITISPQQPINGIYKGDVKVSIKVEDPLAGGTYSGLKSVKYRVFNMGQQTQNGTLYELTKQNPTKAELQKAWSDSIDVKSNLNNSNDVVIEVYAEDNAGNTSRDKTQIKIDTTAPEISVSYNNNSPDSEKYYNADRMATIVVTERNFDSKDVNVKITSTDGTIPTVSDWTESVGNGNQDNTTHTATVTYSADGDYTFEINYTDLASNKCPGETYVNGTANPREFTIDKTAPMISVSYDNNNVQNGKYFNANRVATVTVQEHNFDSNRVVFTQNASISGGAASVPQAGWSSSGDIHTATIPYNADGDYTFDVTMTDMAGNQSGEADYGNSAAAKDFTIDTNITEPKITGIEDGHAYKDEVIPGVDFSDINFSSYEIRLTRTRMEEKNVDVTKTFIKGFNTSGQGGSGTFNTFKKIQENDGIYTLYVKVSDMAGNEKDKTAVFTINRYGSVYVYNDYLISLVKDGGAYTQAVEKDLVITEYNADKLVENSLNIEVTQDGKPLDEVAYKAAPEINNKVAVGSSGWYQYQYTVNKENFSSDGVYKMSVASKDATGNMPEITNYKDKDILFRVDSTVPELTSIVGLEDQIINAQEVSVDYTAYDTIGLKSIKIYVDGEQYGDAVEDFNGDRNNYSGTFELTESSSKQSVRFLIEDMAGNVTDTDDAEFTSAYTFNKAVTVSTNVIVRWFANKPLFIGTIIGIAAALGLIWFMIFGRRKRRDGESA